jgi:hypothetical protein
MQNQDEFTNLKEGEIMVHQAPFGKYNKLANATSHRIGDVLEVAP